MTFILPNQSITLKQSIFGQGAMILELLDSPKSLEELWVKVRDSQIIHNFDRFVVVLDFLYIIGAIELFSQATGGFEPSLNSPAVCKILLSRKFM